MNDRHLQGWCRVLAVLWIAAVIVVSIQATVHHNNNFEIFRTAWRNLSAGHDLYAANPNHFDFFKYSPTFALLFAPFAVVPFGVGVFLWNALNAGSLYWSLGRVLTTEQALAARAIVFLDTVGSMQNVQSNALSAGLMILAFADLQRRQELRAAFAVVAGALIKIFPIAAAAFAIFRPYRLPRFAIYCVGIGIALLAAPLVVLSPAELAEQYRSWGAIQKSDALTRGYSVMGQLEVWFGVAWPNWPVQLLGAAVLIAPLTRLSSWGQSRFRLLFLASVLMFCVLFNHKAESPTFVVALAGVAIWLVLSPRTRGWWVTFAVVIVGTVLSSSDAMPEVLQEGLFEPYRLKTLPVLLVWVMTQLDLWERAERKEHQTASAPLPTLESGGPAPAT
ncbi:MAG: glycosyltransferase family 87 protein [Gemmatimonadaceae bacterium]